MLQACQTSQLIEAQLESRSGPFIRPYVYSVPPTHMALFSALDPVRRHMVLSLEPESYSTLPTTSPVLVEIRRVLGSAAPKHRPSCPPGVSQQVEVTSKLTKPPVMRAVGEVTEREVPTIAWMVSAVTEKAPGDLSNTEVGAKVAYGEPVLLVTKDGWRGKQRGGGVRGS